MATSAELDSHEKSTRQFKSYSVNQATNRKWQMCRIEAVRVDIGPILRTAFCAQGCYSSIDNQQNLTVTRNQEITTKPTE